MSSTGSIRTAKAEKRLKDRLSKEGVRFAEGIVGNTDLSPSEQRALQAEKRAAWRQARLKSLEQDALQAQMVLNRMSEIIDSPPPMDTLAAKTNVNRSVSPSVTVQQLTTTRTSTPERLDNISTRVSSEADQDNNVKIKIVETTEQKIISIELDSPSKSSVNSEEFSTSAGMGNTRHATITSTSSSSTATTSSSSPPSLGNNGNNSSKRKKRKGSKKAKS
jgi:protein scribble